MPKYIEAPPDNDIFLSTYLDGPMLLAANRVLARFGLPQREQPCTLTELLNGLRPIEVGRFCKVLVRLSDALQVVREYPELFEQ